MNSIKSKCFVLRKIKLNNTCLVSCCRTHTVSLPQQNKIKLPFYKNQQRNHDLGQILDYHVTDENVKLSSK